MKKRQKAIRFIVSGILLAAVAVVGMTVYSIDSNKLDESKVPQEQTQTPSPEPEDESSDVPNHAVIDDEEEDIPETEESASGQVDGQIQEQTGAPEEVETQAEPQVEAPVLPALEFTETTLMQWPLTGELLMDYSMDGSVYFATLDQYRYNPAIVVQAEAGTEVLAAANSKVLSIEETPETGTTVTMDMGNGYHAIYGQMENLQVAVDDIVEAGAVIGQVANPTKYYAMEGSNLYFAMTKDEETLDPIVYLP